jgi:hypothetical protein
MQFQGGIFIAKFLPNMGENHSEKLMLLASFIATALSSFALQAQTLPAGTAKIGPKLDVFYNGALIANGGSISKTSYIESSTTALTNNNVITLTVKNSGDEPLTVNFPTLKGSYLLLLMNPIFGTNGILNPGATSSFDVFLTFPPAALASAGTIQLTSNDPRANLYTINAQLLFEALKCQITLSQSCKTNTTLPPTFSDSFDRDACLARAQDWVNACQVSQAKAEFIRGTNVLASKIAYPILPAKIEVRLASTNQIILPSPAPSYSPAPITEVDFGKLTQGTAPNNRSLSIVNRGDMMLIVPAGKTPLISGSSAFSINDWYASGYPIVKNSFIPLNIFFNTTVLGIQRATLTIPSNDPLIPNFQVALKGEIIARPKTSMLVSQISGEGIANNGTFDFGKAYVTNDSETLNLSLNVKNTGTTALFLEGGPLAFEGRDASRYAIISNPFLMGDIAAGSTVSITIGLKRGTIGTHPASLVIKANTGTIFRINLIGEIQDRPAAPILTVLKDSQILARTNVQNNSPLYLWMPNPGQPYAVCPTGQNRYCKISFDKCPFDPDATLMSEFSTGSPIESTAKCEAEGLSRGTACGADAGTIEWQCRSGSTVNFRYTQSLVKKVEKGPGDLISAIRVPYLKNDLRLVTPYSKASQTISLQIRNDGKSTLTGNIRLTDPAGKPLTGAWLDHTQLIAPSVLNLAAGQIQNVDIKIYAHIAQSYQIQLKITSNDTTVWGGTLSIPLEGVITNDFQSSVIAETEKNMRLHISENFVSKTQEWSELGSLVTADQFAQRMAQGFVYSELEGRIADLLMPDTVSCIGTDDDRADLLGPLDLRIALFNLILAERRSDMSEGARLYASNQAIAMSFSNDALLALVKNILSSWTEDHDGMGRSYILNLMLLVPDMPAKVRPLFEDIVFGSVTNLRSTFYTVASASGILYRGFSLEGAGFFKASAAAAYLGTRPSVTQIPRVVMKALETANDAEANRIMFSMQADPEQKALMALMLKDAMK